MRLNLQETVDLVTFAKEILNGKLHFLCSAEISKWLCLISIFYFFRIKLNLQIKLK